MNMVTRKEKSDINALSVWLNRCGWVPRCNNVDRDLEFTLRSLGRLERLRRVLVADTGIQLEPVLRTDWDAKSLKEFCCGILEKDKLHEWTKQLVATHACLRARTTIGSSLFLFRKSIISQSLTKAEKQKKMNEYAERMCTPQSPPDPKILEFTRKLLLKEFPRGWDRSWYDSANNFVLPTKSCLENRLCDGGARGMIGRVNPSDSMGQWADGSTQWKNGVEIPIQRKWYLDFIDGTNLNRLEPSTELAIVPTGGKDRLVSKFSLYRSFLRPLHTTIYNRCSEREWLLRGEATLDRFNEFSYVKGEVFVSGDYESASDNLNIHLSRYIMKCLQSTSLHVPWWVWEAGYEALTSRFPKHGWQQRGQLMGSLLSFPLLCITNFIALKFAVKRNVPVKINGDDIVFRATPDEYSSWESVVSSFGLTLSKGKTLVEKHLFSLNSTFFLSRLRGDIEQVSFFRSSCIFGSAETANALPGRLRSSCVNVRKQTKEMVERMVFKECHKALWGSQRSIRRGLLYPITTQQLLRLRLSERESFYLSLPKEEPLPCQMPGYFLWKFPPGWTRVSTDDPDAVDDWGFTDALIEQAWLPAVSTTVGSDEEDTRDYWDRIRDNTCTFVPFPSMKYAKMAGMSEFEYQERKKFCPRWKSDKGKFVWRRVNVRQTETY